MNAKTTSAIEPRTGCIASAMEVIGAKWTALILRDLAGGAKRYGELQRSLDINPRTLSQRLDQLIEEGIVSHVGHDSSTHKSYSLTPKGTDLTPILEQMAAWGDKHGLNC